VPFLPPPGFFGWAKENYQANGNLFLLLKPPYFDHSIGIDITRDFINQLRLEYKNKRQEGALAFGHRMANYDALMDYFTPFILIHGDGTGPIEPIQEPIPVTYQIKNQKALCPAGLR